MLRFILFLSAMTLFIGCKSTYYTPGSEPYLQKHQRIAILPYETIYNGKVPTDMNRSEWEEIEKTDALAFQADLHDAIKYELKKKGKHLGVEIQDIKTTNHVLAKYGLNIYEARLLSPEKLADTLQVDAVFITQVERQRYMNEEAVVGITAGALVLSVLTGSDEALYDWAFPKKEDVWIDAALFDGETGEILWYMRQDVSISLKKADTVVRQINIDISKHFPYMSR